MKHSLRTYLSSSVKRKMITMVVIMLIFVVSIIDMVTYIVSFNFHLKDAQSNDAQKVQFMSENMDDAISYMGKLMDSISQDVELQTMLQASQQMSYEQRRQLEQVLLEKVMYSTDKFESVYLFNTEDFLVKLNYNPSGNPNIQDDVQSRLKKQRYDTVGRITWRVNNGVIYVERAIRQRDSLKMLGYITISLQDDYLKQRLQSETSRYSYVFDEKDNLLVSSSEDPKINAQDLLTRAKDKAVGVPTLLEVEPFGEMLFTTYVSDQANWRVVSLVPLKEISKGTELIGQWIIGIGLIGVLVGVVLTWLSTKHLIAPLHDLKKVMDQVETDEFDQKVDIKRRDEFGRLGRSFNRMMHKINYLISEVYQKELAQRESEYRALKAQINPHFLYNTLDTIRWLSMYGENKKIENVAVSLAHLLKSNLVDGKEMIPVQSELDYINAYLSIQKTRFENKIQISIHIEDSLKELYIPRFVLQPIVENSFVHGLENKIGTGHLSIIGVRDTQYVKLRVIDDGVGIEENKRRVLLQSNGEENPGSAKGTGNGLKNVHKRIQMLFGEPYGLTIVSTENSGTIIEIILPIVKYPGDSYPSEEKGELAGV
ncbi:sensor histidine kinase [Paenibacillus sp. J22TS3]|uniref:sensor histidine kinase n=1 Tax=Paenibacillus sp. J22TS3 TaxID=2807192 RepID=UPI001B1739D3|nr:sensor histidine kinase [Paenibacillus sp. J22TS3]GIP21169.1 sensor histidine kinase YesM [Paenibacillus sp. J22TS3]